MEEVRRYSGSSVLLALVGNKADLENLREVEFEEAEAICQYMPEVLFVLEASAKENSNIEEAFMCLATELKVGVMILLWRMWCQTIPTEFENIHQIWKIKIIIQENHFE